ncbi:hypothetical protein J4864_02660 [Prevotella multiformis]|uniref:hypothetical protein n=1 Tax=Prevotella multiformis TaxID=282402 RepID=UPI001BAACC43|nr:hypothetical protein [Prevotella multiformis]QUB71139.1 hypothetical protein J4864_02660 [Prevotella multiformis]
MKFRIMKEKGFSLYRTSNTCPFVFMVDGRIPHGGMFDRLKGLITVFAVSKALGKPFRLNWSYPFVLSKYLEPNKYDWIIDESQMTFGLLSYKNIIAYGEIVNPSRLCKKRSSETHFYYGYDSLDKVNAHFGTDYKWGELYRELFRPTAYLQRYLERYRTEIGDSYIAIHTRFMNLLGDKTETAVNPELDSDSQKNALVASAVNAIKKISSQHFGMNVLIASDSMVFIEEIKKAMPDVYIVPGTVKHIDTAGETDDSENIKMFTDYYLISGAQKVYSLWHEGMWKSAFPEYAARIGNVSFERVEF